MFFSQGQKQKKEKKKQSASTQKTKYRPKKDIFLQGLIECSCLVPHSHPYMNKQQPFSVDKHRDTQTYCVPGKLLRGISPNHLHSQAEVMRVINPKGWWLILSMSVYTHTDTHTDDKHHSFFLLIFNQNIPAHLSKPVQSYGCRGFPLMSLNACLYFHQ